MINQFLKDKHNLLKFTAPRSGVNSLIHPENEAYISAYMYASGTAVIQPGRAPGRLAVIPSVSAWLVPPGSLTATGFSNTFFVALDGTPSAHLMAYSPEDARDSLENNVWIPRY